MIYKKFRFISVHHMFSVTSSKRMTVSILVLYNFQRDPNWKNLHQTSLYFCLSFSQLGLTNISKLAWFLLSDRELWLTQTYYPKFLIRPPPKFMDQETKEHHKLYFHLKQIKVGQPYISARTPKILFDFSFLN